MPTAVIRFDSVRFPVTFYLEVMEEMRRAYRAEMVATIAQRTAQAKTVSEHMKQSEWDGTGWSLTIEEIDNSAAALFAPESPQSLNLVGDVTVGNATWRLPTLDEVLSEMRKPYDAATFKISSRAGYYTVPMVTLDVRDAWSSTEITISGGTRAGVQKYADMFGDAAPKYALPVPPPAPPRIFIGHGGSPQWQTLKTYLHDQMGYDVEAFETLPRAGHTIKEVLDTAMVNNNVAILVMTAEDAQADEASSMRARQNVVHETGLFQGRLGFHRTIVLLEDGTEDFSNLAGLQELRYPAGQIRATFGDIIATLQREFPS